MSPQNKTIWVNLGALGALLIAAGIVYAAMKGAPGARHWTSQLETGSFSERSRAANALENMGPVAASAVPALLAILQTPDSPNAGSCARALKAIDPQSAYEFANALIARVERDEVSLTPKTIEVFAGLGSVAWKAAPLLRNALRNRTEHSRDLIPALIDMGDYSDEVVAKILEDARDPVYSTRKWDAMLALDRLGYRALAYRSELEHLSSDPTPAVASQAKIILAQLDRTPEYSRSGLRGFPDMDRGYQDYALTVLSKQGARAAEAMPDIVRSLQSRYDLIRFLAARTLTHVGTAARSAIPQLRAAAADGKSLVRDSAVDALRALESPQ